MTTTLRFSLSIQPFSLITAVVLGCKYGHVEFVLPDGKLLASLPSGVVIRDVPKDDIYAKTYTLDIDNGYEYALSQLGKPYDWLAVVGLPFDRDWQDDNSWFCSELCLTSLVKAGFPKSPNLEYKVSPHDLHKLLDAYVDKTTPGV
jgi:uncharacterized protein YycO